MNPNENETRYRLSEKLRKRTRRNWIDQNVAGTLFFLSLSLLGFWTEIYDFSEWNWELLTLFFLVGFTLLYIAFTTINTRDWLREEKFQYEYELDSEGIRQYRPSGAQREAR